MPIVLEDVDSSSVLGSATSTSLRCPFVIRLITYMSNVSTVVDAYDIKKSKTK